MDWLALQVALVAVAWGFCYLHSHWLTQAVAKTLLPWLIGMSMVLAIFLGIKEWLPRSDWPSIFWLETEAINAEVFLEKLSPYPFIQSLGLLLILCFLNIRYPTWKPWSKRLKKSIAVSAKAISVLSVLTSFTFFAADNGSIIRKATAKEKYERLKEQANAHAGLMVGARLTQDTKAEAKNATAFLSAIGKQLSIDMRLPAFSGARGDVRERLRQLVQRDANELLQAMKETPAVKRIAYNKDQLADTISRRFTKEQIKEEKDAFKETLDHFVDKGADISVHPFTEALTSLGLPELPEAILHELYTSEVSHLAKKITDPLADSLFRPGSRQANGAPSELAEIANRSIFDVASLSKKLTDPMIEDRAPEFAARRKGEVRAAERFAEELDRMGDPYDEIKEIARKTAREVVVDR
ncbi:hypothetical protein [Bradyrhizobium manausense]|uniref:Uncharacterized protein n=1 Tax=Bradyrhizobium manausense TaxID=989370 RepID=A0A0R3DKA0_9BRAD|nr:hypothetical protein [Bradyrhizobium manausense]KRQ10265.1 hypothetical protein AOQ71_20100 [Bradyrhizobium manausense]